MSTALSGSLGLSINTSFKNTSPRITSKGDVNVTYSDAMTHGTGPGQCNRHYSAQLSIGAASSVTIDLMSLLDVLGAALTLVKAKHIILRPLAANANKVTMGAAASNAFLGPLGGTTPTLDLEAGESYKLSKSGTGWTVDATHKDLKFANAGAGTCLVDVDIYGTDA